MECFLLGTGGMMPMPGRFLTSLVARVAGELYLFDAGEGCQIPYKKLHLGLRNLGLIAISHLHADHVLGLPGILMLRAQVPDPLPLTVLGPPGLRRFVNNIRRDLAIYINYRIEIHEWSDNGSPIAYENDQLQIHWYPLEHSVVCLGYRLVEHDRPGKFDVEAAMALGIRPGPDFGRLQNGETIELLDGRKISPSHVMGPIRRGRRIAFATDTAFTTRLQPLLRDVDLAFVESMFLEEHEAEAATKMHMTATQAARAARLACAQRLVLMHFSPRYEARDVVRFAEEARREYPEVVAARDLQVFEIPLPNE
jgi:ribonuclease Z